jgi:hypothetical protein
LPWVMGEAGSPVAVGSLPARGRPPEAAARGAGLVFVEKLLTAQDNQLDEPPPERDPAMPALPYGVAEDDTGCILPLPEGLSDRDQRGIEESA